MEQKNSAKSVILPHKHRINNVSGRKASFSQHTVGLFSMSSLQTHERRHWWASNVTQTHLEDCEEKKKNQNTAQEKKNVRCFLAIYNASFMSVRWSGEGADINRSLSGYQVDLQLPGFGPITKQTTSIMNRCFIIMGHAVDMNVSLITGIKTYWPICKCFSHLL